MCFVEKTSRLYMEMVATISRFEHLIGEDQSVGNTLHHQIQSRSHGVSCFQAGLVPIDLSNGRPRTRVTFGDNSWKAGWCGVIVIWVGHPRS